MSGRRNWPASLVSVFLLWSCGTASPSSTVTVQADRFADAEWSDPVNLGPVVNSSAAEASAALSPDEHTLYFISNRPGGLGGNDVWASHRRCKTCEWETPYNLGAPINSAAAEGAPTLSGDGRMLFFFTTRADGFGNADIYVYDIATASTIKVTNNSQYFQTTATLLLYLDHGSRQITGAVTQNTIGAPAPAVKPDLATAADGTVSGTVTTTSSRQFVLAGWVKTSHGRVKTEIRQQIDFSNAQRFIAPISLPQTWGRRTNARRPR